jgi:hypothetical protein
LWFGERARQLGTGRVCVCGFPRRPDGKTSSHTSPTKHIRVSRENQHVKKVGEEKKEVVGGCVRRAPPVYIYLHLTYLLPTYLPNVYTYSTITLTVGRPLCCALALCVTSLAFFIKSVDLLLPAIFLPTLPLFIYRLDTPQLYYTQVRVIQLGKKKKRQFGYCNTYYKLLYE